MATLHQFPVARNRRPSRTAEAELSRALRQAVDTRVGSEASFEAREAAALELTNEATRLFLRDELSAIADSHGEEVEVDGVIYKRHEPGTVTYYSLCGNLEVERCTYRRVGLRNGPTIVPMELAAGLVERATPALGYRVALGYAKSHMRSCEEDMKGDHRRPPSRSTLERIAKAVGTKAKEAAPRIEPRIRRAETVPPDAVAISLGLDRTAVPMEESLAAGREPATRRKKRAKPYVRAKPERVDVNYRMAYVGTISIHNAAGEELATRRYAATADESPTERVVTPLMADLRAALRRAPRLVVGVVQDGAPELWNLLRAALLAEPLVTGWCEAIDRYHLNERLAEVLRCTEPNAATRQAKLSRWNDDLETDERAIDSISHHVEECYRRALARGEDELAEQLEPHVTYLENNADRMTYATLCEAGLPLGSGVTEGACKSVIKMRTNGSGQRWRPIGLAAVVTMRAVHLSNRLPRFWAHLARGYKKDVRACA